MVLDQILIHLVSLDPISILALPFTQAPAYGPPGFGGVGGLGFLLVIVVLVVARRITYAIHGRRYSTGRVMMLPVLYTFLTLVTVVSLEYLNPIALLSLLTMPAGFVVGYMFGKQVKFFERGGVLFFKRSPVILILWLVSYIARIVLLYILGTDFQIVFLVDSILALTSGLIIGEAVRVIKGHTQYQSSPSEQPEEVDMMKEL